MKSHSRRRVTQPRGLGLALTLLLLAAPQGCKKETSGGGRSETPTTPAANPPVPDAGKPSSPPSVSYKPLQILETKTLAPFSRNLVSSAFAPDLSHVLTIVREAGGLEIRLNNKRIASGYTSVTKAVINMDSSRLVYIAEANWKWRMGWVNLKSRGPAQSRRHKVLLPSTLGFVKGCAVFSYLTINSRGKYEAVVNGRTITEHDRVGPISHSPGGKHFAYTTTDGGKKLRRLFYDGKPVASGKKIVVEGLGRAAGKYAYSVFDGKAWTITVDGAAHPQAYNEIAGFRYSPDGRRTAYLARRGKRWFAVIDGAASRPYDDVGAPVFSPDSKRVGFAAMEGASWRMIIDGKPGATHLVILEGSPVFSPDSKHVAYAAVEAGGGVVVRDGVRGKHYDVISSFPLTFSATGNHLAFVVGTARTTAIRTAQRRRMAAGKPAARKHHFRWQVVIDGKALPAQDLIGRLYLSPKGERVAYIARQSGRWAIYTADRKSPSYWSIHFHKRGGGVRFLDERRIMYSAVDPAKGFMVVTARLP